MAALATVADLTARIGTLTASQTQRAPALLEDASGLVRGYTRQEFELISGDEVILRPIVDHLRLPQRPVVGVTSVAIVGPDGTPGTSFDGWRWDGVDKIYVTGHGIVGLADPFWPWSRGVADFTYQVTYDHGYSTIPDDVVAVVCNMVNRVLTAPSLSEGLVAERLGAYSYQAQQSTGSMGAAVRLTQADRDDLDNAGYRRKTGTVVVR